MRHRAGLTSTPSASSRRWSPSPPTGRSVHARSSTGAAGTRAAWVGVQVAVAVAEPLVLLVRERDQGTGEQMAVSPLRRGELMIGKLLPWTILAFLDVVAIIAVGMGVFGVPLRGDPVVLAVAAVLFVFASLGMGLVISALAPTVDTASITALLVAFLPSFLLSGFAFALDQIPLVLQWIASAFPARYFVTVSRAVFLKGAGPGRPVASRQPGMSSSPARPTCTTQ